MICNNKFTLYGFKINALNPSVLNSSLDKVESEAVFPTIFMLLYSVLFLISWVA